MLMNKILRYSFVALMAMFVGNVMADDQNVVFTFNTDAGIEELGIAKPSAGAGTELKNLTTPNTLSKGVITITNVTGGGKTETRVWNASGTLDLRIYSTSTLTFTTSEKVIKKIVLAGNTVGGFTANVGSFNAGTWEGASTSVVLTATGTEKINTITVTYGDASGKTATTINFAEGYKTKIGRGPDEMFPELGSFVALPTATVKAGDAVVSSEVEWTLDLTSWDGKEGKEQPSISDGKINNLNNGSGLITVKASYAGSETYEASTKSYDLKVYSPYGLLSEMVGDIFDPTFEKDDMNDKDGKPVFYFFRNIDAAGIPVVTNTVTFVSGNYIYLTDGTANLLFYGNNSQNLKKGDVISGNVSDTNLGGFWGNLKRYNKLPEFAFTDMNVKVESEGATVTPKTIKIDELAANINNYVKVENAEFVSASGKNLTFKVGETTLAVYNQFNLKETVINALEATAMYTIEAMGSVYKKNKDTDAVYQLYPITFTKTSEPTGINTIKTDADANAPVYNLAGQKVDKNYKGVVIMNGKKMIQK